MKKKKPTPPPPPPSYFEQHYDAVRFPLARDDKPGLRNAQQGALHAIASHFSVDTRPALLVLPTGAGKTAVLMATPFLLRARRALVIAPSVLVRQQIAENFEELRDLRATGVLDASTPLPNVVEVTKRLSKPGDWTAFATADVVIATPHTISPKYTGVPKPPADLFDVVLVDEAHHSPAATWQRLLDVFVSARKALFTATPFRGDDQEIVAHLVYNYPLSRARADGVYGKIEFVAVPTDAATSADIAIAKAAETALRADQKAGFDHRVLVKTESKDRAKDIAKVYDKSTKLKLMSVNSDHGNKHAKRAIKLLGEGKLDGIISVGMFGEGFDFPQLKIAALHAPHKSLGATLQFVGRFARTAAAKLGPAKFLAVPNEIEFQTTKLYEEGASWGDLISNLAETRVQAEQKLREELTSFATLRHEAGVEEVALYAVNPFFHTKVFRIDPGVTVDLETPFKTREDLHVLTQRTSKKLSATVIVTREIEPSTWTSQPGLGTVTHDLTIVYFNTVHRLLMICSTRRTIAFYDDVADLYAGNRFHLLSLARANGVLQGFKDLTFFNVGMKNKAGHSNLESYRISTGPKAHEAISETDGLMFNRGHVFGRGTDEDGNVTTIGFSSSAKIWSSRHDRIPVLIEWLKKIADRAAKPYGGATGSKLDLLPLTEEVTSIPAKAIAACWDDQIFRSTHMLTIRGKDDKAIAIDLIDVDLVPTSSGANHVELRATTGTETIDFRLDVDKDGPRFTISDARKIVIERGKEKTDFDVYLRHHPPTVFLATFAMLSGSDLSPFKPLKEGWTGDECKAIDWSAAGVDITTEFGPANSIHEYLKGHLKTLGFEVLVYDHRTGEVADFLGFKAGADGVHVQLFHCKPSRATKPGDRVEDVYEVAGQAAKCTKYLRAEVLRDKLLHRLHEGKIHSEILVGTEKRLKEIFTLMAGRATRYEVIVVQPGVSKAGVGETQKPVLLAASDFINRALGTRLGLWVSA